MTVIPTSYFGSIGYFRLIFSTDLVNIECFEHFVKQTFRNRCSILTANGIQHLSVPVIKPNGNKTLTRDVLVSPKQDWRKDHWKAIESAYASAPYFDYYGDEVKSLIYSETSDLITYNEQIISFIAETLSLSCSIQYTNEYAATYTNDYRSKSADTQHNPYIQVLFNQPEFVSNLSILDALFCEGPLTRNLIIDTHNSN